jgi:site-specific DNA-methyltransferase (adenine-specific)
MQITPYSKNAKKHPKKQIEQVAASIKEFGMNQPIVVDKQGVIIVGHGRYEALKLLGLEVKPEWVKVVDLTEEQAKAYRLADNKLNESDWDMALVVEELKGLSEPMLDLTGFDKDLVIEADEADDEVPDVPEEPQSKLGDLYELGEHRVLCGDSTKIEDVERLMDGKKADMVFTDPPYGVDYDGGHAEKGKRRDKLENDDETDMYAGSLPLAYAYTVDSAPLYLWFADRFAKDVLNALDENDYQVRTWIIWNKNMAQFGAIGAQYKTKHEPVIYAFKKGKAPTWNGPTNEVTVWDVDRHSKNEFHPTQKPTALSERAILNHIGTEGVVLDLFLGSGATLIGATKTGRICYGMELDPKYVDVIVQRYVDYTGNASIKKNGQEIIWQAKKQENQ